MMPVKSLLQSRRRRAALLLARASLNRTAIKCLIIASSPSFLVPRNKKKQPLASSLLSLSAPCGDAAAAERKDLRGGDGAAEAANGAVETLMDAGFHLN
jgi:hypothetical protein